MTGPGKPKGRMLKMELKKFADLQPKEGTIKANGQEYHVKKYSLRAKAYFIGKYGVEKFTEMLQSPANDVIFSEIIWFLIDEKGKKDFPTLESFQECFSTVEEQISIINTASVIVGWASKSGNTAEEDAELIGDGKKK